MDTDALLTLSSFCRVRMQARPVFSTVSQTYVSDVINFIKQWQSSRSEQTPLVLAFSKAVADAFVETKTKRDQLIVLWLLCSLLMERMTDAGKLYWQCEHTRRIYRLSSSVSCISVDERDSSISVPPRLTPELAKPLNQDSASTKLSSNVASCSHTPIPARDSATVYCAPFQNGHALQTSKFDFFLPDVAESKDVLVFCTKMIQKGKYFRSCCVRRLDDCCDGKNLKECLMASNVHVVFVQQSIHKELKEVFIRCNVLFLDRLGRGTVDASEKTLRWTVFENLSHWLFILRAKSGQGFWRSWAATTKHQFGLILKLRVRHYPESAGEGIAPVQNFSYSAMTGPTLREVNSAADEAKRLGTGDDVEAVLLRNSFLAVLLCACGDGRVNAPGENRASVIRKETVMRTLEIACQVCRALM
ncbi:hypothetical protein JKF63_03416 [Porcisia hertigi]|uniref:Uncharacterized protein n=1 Tax=Porcisia hertigi TaxID=2761500 RepID=A0A836HYY8_9TRYP|nr:hypothetical protein JKF63_03416 [Porcisia hertigi]